MRGRWDSKALELSSIGPVPEDPARNLCHINDIGDGKRIWFVHAPYGGEQLRFRGEPTSLLYAIAPLVEELRSGRIPGFGLSDVALLNPQSGGPAFHAEFRRRLQRQRLRLLCVSAGTAASAEARILARIAKDCDPNIIVVFGGPHEDDSIVPGVEFSAAVDFAVRGDGEFALLELGRLILSRPSASADEIKVALEGLALQESPLRRLDHSGRGIIAYTRAARCGRGRTEHILCASRQGLRSDTIDVERLPLMPRELVLDEDTRQFSIFRRHGRNLRTAQIMTQRGCHWSCSFCSESAERQPNRKVTGRRVESVIDEVEAVLSMGYQAIFFDDSTFTSWSAARQKYLEVLFSHLARRVQTHDLEWGCQTRVDQVDVPTLQTMKAAGCTYVYLGVESSSDEMLRHMHKALPAGAEHNCLKRAFDAVNEVGMRVGVSLMFGAARPGTDSTAETRETVLETLRFIQRQATHGNIACVSLNLATYYPATRMTKESGRETLFERPIVHHGYPWNRYEEGEGYHPGGVDHALADFIVRSAVEHLGEYLVDQDLYAIDEILRPYRNGQIPRERAIYLNHASLTQPLDAAERAASVSKVDEDQTALVRQARTLAADLFGLPHSLSKRVAFGRNTTEAVSLALHLTGLDVAREPIHVLTTSAENLSVQRVFRLHRDHGNRHGRDMWSTFQDYGTRSAPPDVDPVDPSDFRTGFSVDEVKIPTDGERFDVVGALLDALRPETRMVVFSHVVRDDGRILDVGTICAALRQARPDLWILVDGAQALGALPSVDVRALDCDFYVGTPHKTLGSHPLGLLYFGERAHHQLHRGVERLAPPFHVSRGTFDESLRVPTTDELSLPEFRSFVAAVHELRRRELVVGARADGLTAHRRRLRALFLGALGRSAPSSLPIEHGNQQSDFIVSLRLPGFDARAVAERLWRTHWVFVSYVARSEVLRVSFGADTTERDVVLAAWALAEAMTDSVDSTLRGKGDFLGATAPT